LGNEKCVQYFGQNFKVRDHLGDLNVPGKIILKWIFKEIQGVD
jgi:hypothetical protein